MKQIRLLLVFALLLVSFGCGTANPGQGSNNGSTPAAAPSKDNTSPKEPAAPAASKEKTIKHAMGTTVLNKTPERVVILFCGMVDIAAALGVKPVGAVESWDEKPWFRYLGNRMEGVKVIGEENQPNIEAIVGLKPDLIIATKARHEKIYSQLTAIAPTIVTEELFNWKDNLKIASEALDKQAEADKIMKDWDSRVAEFKKKMGDRLATTEVSVVRFEKDGSARYYVTGFPGTILKEVGLARPKAQQSAASGSAVTLTSKEHITQLDGDYIFDITTQLNGEKQSVASQTDWTSHTLWKNLKGVKNGKYIKVDPITWNLGGGVLAAQAVMDDLYLHFGLK